MAEPIIQIENLTKEYAETTAVDRLSLSINSGEIFGLLGPNGAGKSTTILTLLGLTDPTSGNVNVCGIDSTRYPIDVKKRVGYLPDDIGFYNDRTGLDNLLYTAHLNSIRNQEARERAWMLLKRVGLEESAQKKAGKYSRGMRQRLGLADVLIKNPEVIILDEPTLGIDPVGIQEFLDMIQRLSRDEGLTVLLSSHQLHQVQQICDRVGLFVEGQLLAQGNVTTLAEQLFADKPITTSIHIDPLTEDCLQQLNDIPDIQDIRHKGSLVTLESPHDITEQAANIVLASDSSLQSITKKAYGLDEIYHKYFEGGEVNEGQSDNRTDSL